MNRNLMTSLVAAAVALGASASSFGFTEVYKGDNFSLEIGGDLEVQYRTRTTDGDDADIEYDDAEVHFRTKYDFGGLTAFGQLDLDFKDAADGKDTDDWADKLFLGVETGGLTLGVGKWYYASDRFYDVSYDYEMGGNIGFDTTDGSDVIYVGYETGGFEIIATTDIAETDGDGFEDEKSFDLFAGFELGGFDLGVAYQDFTDSADADNPNPESLDTMGIYAAYDLGAGEVGISFSANDNGDYVQLGGEFDVSDSVSLAGGYEMLRGVPDDGAEVASWYLNGTYAFNKNVKTFIEIGGEDEDGVDSQLGWLLGFRVRW